ncbi:MAG: sugar ABC transporter permease [Actinomycetes bacterium]
MERIQSQPPRDSGDALDPAGPPAPVAAVDPVSGVDARVALAQALDVPAGSLGEYARGWLKRARGGESGALPVLIALAAIVVFFQAKNSLFLSAGNLINLLIQGAPYILLGMAEVFVLLLGEIDLSIGFVAGIGGVITAALIASPHNFPWWAGVLAALAGTAAIGALQGSLITRLRLPSFVVTLAGLLGWEGVLIEIISLSGSASGGTISIAPNGIIYDITAGNLSPTMSWVVMVAIVAAFGTVVMMRDGRRRANMLTAPLGLSLLKIGAAAVAGVVVVLVANTDRGVAEPVRGLPWVVLIVLGLLAAWTLLLGRTRFGRYVYAIGGSPEAARRAGVNLTKIRTLAFTLTGLTAGIAGIVYASRLGSISTNVDGGSLVLYAVAAAVIGGTSLFGGRGKMLHAVLGGLVVATIYNGLGLIGMDAATQYIVTAIVLLAAVIIDTVARRGQRAK